jgi:hypothetical protein
LAAAALSTRRTSCSHAVPGKPAARPSAILKMSTLENASLLKNILATKVKHLKLQGCKHFIKFDYYILIGLSFNMANFFMFQYDPL